MNTIREFIFNLSYSGLLPSYFQYAFVINSLIATY